MCFGFGGIITVYGDIFWIEPDENGDVSHSDILLRYEDHQLSPSLYDGIAKRNFIRFEFPDWTVESFRWDEYFSLPAWAKDRLYELQERAIKLMLRVQPFYAKSQEAYKNATELLHNKRIAEVKKLDVKYKVTNEIRKSTFWRELREQTGYKEAVTQFNKTRNLITYRLQKQLSKIKGYLPKQP